MRIKVEVVVERDARIAIVRPAATDAWTFPSVIVEFPDLVRVASEALEQRYGWRLEADELLDVRIEHRGHDRWVVATVGAHAEAELTPPPDHHLAEVWVHDLPPEIDEEAVELARAVPARVGRPSCVNLDPPPLAEDSWLRVGGRPAFVARPATFRELSEVVEWAATMKGGYNVMGSMSNVVIGDQVSSGVIFPAADYIGEYDPVAGTVEVGASTELDRIVEWGVARGWTGLAALSCIPGTIGGAVVQNAGAYGWEIKSFIRSVTVYDRDQPDAPLVRLGRSACKFGYRTSLFKQTPVRDATRYIIWSVELSPPEPLSQSVTLTERCHDDVLKWLRRASGLRVGAELNNDLHRRAVIEVRKRKSTAGRHDPSHLRSVGSFFKNIRIDVGSKEEELCARTLESKGGLDRFSKIYDFGEGRRVRVVEAWKLLEHVGFRKGQRFQNGRVGLSPKHSLVVVNRMNASAADIVAAANRIHSRVRAELGISLSPEAVPIGFEWPWENGP